jgi:hypothetical protein
MPATCPADIILLDLSKAVILGERVQVVQATTEAAQAVA